MEVLKSEVSKIQKNYCMGLRKECSYDRGKE